MSNNKYKPIILAAGGILWKGQPFHSDIAVIYRKSHGNEWSLPKGKYDPQKDKSLEETAFREIQEETGCRAEIYKFATILKYRVKLRKKQVFYWHLVLKEECKFIPSEEVDLLIWMPPEEAIRILTHRDQRKLIRKFISSSTSSKKRFILPWIFTWARYHRLAGSILAYKLELANRKYYLNTPAKENNYWLDKAIELINHAEIALQGKNIDEAYKCFHAAQRQEIFALDNEELKVRGAIVINESQKLSSWRKDAVEEMLGKTNKPIDNLTRERVYQAVLLRDEHYNNQAFKDSLLRNHVGFLVIIIFLIIVALILIFELKQNNQLNYLEIVLFGLFGGAFSAVINVPSSIHDSKIPDLSRSLRLTLLRIFIGAASAFIIYLVLRSDFFNILINNQVKNPATYYVVAFVSGFSEKLVLKAVNAVAGGK